MLFKLLKALVNDHDHTVPEFLSTSPLVVCNILLIFSLYNVKCQQMRTNHVSLPSVNTTFNQRFEYRVIRQSRTKSKKVSWYSLQKFHCTGQERSFVFFCLFFENLGRKKKKIKIFRIFVFFFSGSLEIFEIFEKSWKKKEKKRKKDEKDLENLFFLKKKIKKIFGILKNLFGEKKKKDFENLFFFFSKISQDLEIFHEISWIFPGFFRIFKSFLFFFFSQKSFFFFFFSGEEDFFSRKKKKKKKDLSRPVKKESGDFAQTVAKHNRGKLHYSKQFIKKNKTQNRN